MGIGVFRRSGWLRVLRKEAAGFARLLLLALGLQLSLPLLSPDLVASQAMEAVFRADLQASVCHDQGAGPAPEGMPAAEVQAGHCVLCLPLAGDPATATPEPQPPLPSSTATRAATAPADQVPADNRPDHARSRAPPSDPRTV